MFASFLGLNQVLSVNLVVLDDCISLNKCPLDVQRDGSALHGFFFGLLMTR